MALVCAWDGNKPVASSLPFYLTSANDGTPRAAFHVARHNPLVKLADGTTSWLLAVNGADAYVSPDWYVSPDQVPTWLYQAVHLTGPVRAMSEDELAAQIETLSAKFEERLLPKKPWLSSKMTAGRLEALKKAIVGLEMTVEEVEGSFKLNQHKSETDYAAIAGSLAAQADAGAQQIAHLMRAGAAQRVCKPSGLCQRNEPARKERAMTLTDSHQPKDRRRARPSPPCSSTARPERRGSAFRSGLRLQNDVVVKSIAEEKRKDAGRQAGADGGGGSRHPLPA